MARRGPLVKSVKVGPYRYRVVYDNVYLDSINALGVVRPKELTILVKSGFDPLYELQIIFHELRHATLEVQAEYDLNNNEAFVDRDASAWLAVLIDNPSLLTAIGGIAK